MTGILDGKVALVTGGASGIGRATAVAMAREGARVAVADRAEATAADTVALINAAGGQAIAIGGDVTREADVAAKHGVVGLTKTAAMEYAQDGIRVNCVNPGYIKTPMTRETMEERFDEIMTKVPMRRLGIPEEIAEAVVWMCSDKASFMTGA